MKHTSEGRLLSLVLTTARSEKLDLRVPPALKAALRKEAAERGFRKLSQYVLAILLERGKK